MTEHNHEDDSEEDEEDLLHDTLPDATDESRFDINPSPPSKKM